MKILRVIFDNILIFKDKFDLDFIAQDKVFEDSAVFNLYGPMATQQNLALFGINASGKTTALKLINLALEIVLHNSSLNSLHLPSIFLTSTCQEKGIEMVVYFYKDDRVFELKSTIKYRLSGEDHLVFYFQEETLKSKAKSTVTSKKKIFDFSDKGKVASIKRSELDPKIINVLKDDISIVIAETKENKVSVKAMFESLASKVESLQGKVQTSILNVFDENIEHLERLDDGEIKCKFKNNEASFRSNVQSMDNLISSGTLRGQEIIKNAIQVLKDGGYLLVDELENHLNKELVRMIINIFNNSKTNKNGACLVFSSHYAELLDFSERMDNIYLLTRDKENFSVLQRYSEQVKRNEWKKSEVIFSNYIKGTAPKAVNIAALEDYICENI